MLNKGQLKDLLNNYDIRPNKLLGQTFLVDKNMQQKILANCNLTADDIVLEIGPGLGALTFDIAKSVKRVFAIEKDKSISQVLADISTGYNNLKIISCDILNFNLREIFKDKPLKIIGNLPYYITTPIMSYLIKNRGLIDSIFIAVQKEIGRRIVASPGSKDYSPISIYTQFYLEPRYLFLITKRVFYPEPEVDSAFMRLDVLKKPKVKVKDEKFFFKVVREAFSKRRKTVLNVLASSQTLGLAKKDVEKLLKKLGIDCMRRPEDLSLQDFADITNSI